MRNCILVLLLAGTVVACDRPVQAPMPPPADASMAPVTTGGSAPAQAVAADGLVLPGDFAEATTLEHLRERFGADAVRIETADEDGWIRQRVVLFADDPARRAHVEFHRPSELAGIASITVRERGSLWRGKHGVRVGMSLAELRRANGGPFHLSGFDERGRARVHDSWSPAEGGDARLGRLDVEAGEHMYLGVELGLRSPLADIPHGEVPRDDDVSSDDSRYPRLGELAEVTAIIASTSLDDEWE